MSYEISFYRKGLIHIKTTIYKQGDIVYVSNTSNKQNDDLMHKGRPAVIISRNSLCATSKVVTVVYLTRQQKNDMASHIRLYSVLEEGVVSTALCEEPTTLSKKEIEQVMGHLNKRNMCKLTFGLLWANVPEFIFNAIGSFVNALKYTV